MVLNTHSFKRVWLDQYLTWRDAASVRIKLKVPPTQRHHHERAARARWLAISKVRFLYGLTTYSTTFKSLFDDVISTSVLITVDIRKRMTTFEETREMKENV